MFRPTARRDFKRISLFFIRIDYTMRSRPYFSCTVFLGEIVQKNIHHYKQGWHRKRLLGENMAAVAVDILCLATRERRITAIWEAAKKMLAEEAFEHLKNKWVLNNKGI